MPLQKFYGSFTQGKSVRTTFLIKDTNPGPGSYNVCNDITNTFKKSFGKDGKLQMKCNDVPAATKYKINHSQVFTLNRQN